MTYLCADEPAEVTWFHDTVEVVWSVQREWWVERIAVRAKNYGGDYPSVNRP